MGYALLQDTEKSINKFEIHHLEWIINELALSKLAVNYKRFDKLLKHNPDKIQYSSGVQVIAWGKTIITTAKGNNNTSNK